MKTNYNLYRDNENSTAFIPINLEILVISKLKKLETDS